MENYEDYDKHIAIVFAIHSAKILKNIETSNRKVQTVKNCKKMNPL